MPSIGVPDADLARVRFPNCTEFSKLTARADKLPEQLHAGLLSCEITDQDPLLLAVSGGADSMALLRAACTLKRPDVTVAYVDHGLRAESTADGDFVRNQALKAAFHFRHLEIADGVLNSAKSGSLEEAARKERYRLLTQCAEEQGIGFVVTAHHFDDQAETVLHNIARGTGLRGLRGMQPVRELSPCVKLARPMLKISRSEIEAYLEGEGVACRHDPTNASDAHTRNRLRHRLIPQLKDSVNEAADRHLVQLAEQAQEALAALDEIAVEILAECVLENSEATCRVSRQSFGHWPETIVRHALSMLWIKLGWPRRKMSRQHFVQLTRMTLHGDPQRMDLPACVTAEIDGDLLRLRRG